MAFFGTVVHLKKVWPYVPPPEGSRVLNLRQVALGPADAQAPGRRSSLMAKVGDGDPICLGTLVSGRTDFMSLDLMLDRYAELSIVGDCPLHVSGYFLPENDEDDEDEDEMAGMFGPEEGEEDSEEEEGGEGDKEGEERYPDWKRALMASIPDEDDEDEDPDFETEDEEDPEDTMLTVEDGGFVVPEGQDGAGAGMNGTADGNRGEQHVLKSGKKDVKKGSKRPAPGAPAAPEPKKRTHNPDDGGQENRITDKDKKLRLEKKAGQTQKAGEKETKANKKGQVVEYSNGLKIEKLVLGTGQKVAKAGKKVVVKYTGRLESGKVFDKTKGNSTFTFRLGCGEVISGWDKGVMHMRVGDKRRLTVPPSMGYGAQGVHGVIPPNAVLTFDVELVNVH